MFVTGVALGRPTLEVYTDAQGAPTFLRWTNPQTGEVQTLSIQKQMGRESFQFSTSRFTVRLEATVTSDSAMGPRQVSTVSDGLYTLSIEAFGGSLCDGRKGMITVTWDEGRSGYSLADTTLDLDALTSSDIQLLRDLGSQIKNSAAWTHMQALAEFYQKADALRPDLGLIPTQVPMAFAALVSVANFYDTMSYHDEVLTYVQSRLCPSKALTHWDVRPAPVLLAWRTLEGSGPCADGIPALLQGLPRVWRKLFTSCWWDCGSGYCAGWPGGAASGVGCATCVAAVYWGSPPWIIVSACGTCAAYCGSGILGCFIGCYI
jgi:hypothetical protein